jgi:transcriptional regulator with XRE-family HTH domain
MAHVGQGSWESRKPVITHEACSLDAAERGPLTLAEVAERLGISRERVRQLERYALRKLEKKYGTELLEALAERIASAPAGYVYPDAFEAKPRRRNYGIKRPCSW